MDKSRIHMVKVCMIVKWCFLMEKQNGVQNGINVGLLKYCYSNDSIIWESRSRFTKFKTLLVEKTVIVELGESQPRYSDPTVNGK